MRISPSAVRSRLVIGSPSVTVPLKTPITGISIIEMLLATGVRFLAIRNHKIWQSAKVIPAL
jgi:hypothetical protein